MQLRIKENARSIFQNKYWGIPAIFKDERINKRAHCDQLTKHAGMVFEANLMDDGSYDVILSPADPARFIRFTGVLNVDPELVEVISS